MSTEGGGSNRDRSGRFQSGHTGNPRGRPKRSKTVGGAITGAFGEKVPITEGGRRRKISKLEAAAKQIANKSASGDLKSAKLGLDLVQKAEERQTREPATSKQLSESDQEIVARLMTRMRNIIMEEKDGRDHATNPDDANRV